MGLFLSFLPYYLLGNLHCAGMCGPLVFFINRNRFRHLYFFGRLLSYTFAGLLAAEAGLVIQLITKKWQVAAWLCLIFGLFIFLIGLLICFKASYPGYKWMAKKTISLSQQLSILMAKESPLAAFLFGFFTVILPCGQTLVVFSACALSNSLLEGSFNGFAFAFLTSPALLFTMHSNTFLKKFKKKYHLIMGFSTIGVGILTFCRGLADLDYIPHLLLNNQLHIVIF